jgi:hypothetical protein
VKRNGLAGRSGLPFDEVQVALDRWNREVANRRVHGSIRRSPSDVFEQEERAVLRPLPESYHPALWKAVRVHPDGHVAFCGRLLSVPWQLLHTEVWVRAAGKTIAIFHQDRRVAVHSRFGPRRSTLEQHLPADRSALRHRGRTFWEERAGQIGSETLGLVRELFDSDDVVSQLRAVQAIVTHLERHPRGRAEATSRLVRVAGDRSYRAVRDTLVQALDRMSPRP